MLFVVSKPPGSWLHFAFHFGTEFLQSAEILMRLYEADRLKGGEGDGYEISSGRFDAALQAIRAGLRTPEELAAGLSREEIKALRDQWDSEVRSLVGIMWEKYSDTMHARTKRRHALAVMKDDPDPRIETKKMHAAAAIGHAGPGSVDRILSGKKAQGGIYDIDARLLKPDANVAAITGYIVPPVPVPPRKKR